MEEIIEVMISSSKPLLSVPHVPFFQPINQFVFFFYLLLLILTFDGPSMSLYFYGKFLTIS